MTHIEPFYPIAPGHAEPCVEASGIETAIEFLLNFGGAELYIARDPKGKGMVERVIGYEKTKRLVDVSCKVRHRVPLANKGLAQCLHCQGLLVASAARRLRRSDITMRKYLAGSGVTRAA